MRSTLVTRFMFPLMFLGIMIIWTNRAWAGPAIEDQLRALMASDWRVRREACDALGNTQLFSSRIVTALADRLEDKDTLVRYAAAKALGKMGSDAHDAIPSLVRALGQDYVGIAASKALYQIGPQAVPPLVQVISNPNEPAHFRITALETLARFGPEARPAVPYIVNSLRSPSISVKMMMPFGYTLGAMGNQGREAAPALLALCDHSENLIRLEAARTLGKIGPLKASEVHSLARSLKEEVMVLRGIVRKEWDAQRRKLTPSSEKRKLWEQADWAWADELHRCARVQIEMVLALEKLQTQLPYEQAREAVMPILVEVLACPHIPSFNWHEHSLCPQCSLFAFAARALRLYGPEAKEAVPVLKGLLQYEMPRHDIKETIEALQPGY